MGRTGPTAICSAPNDQASSTQSSTLCPSMTVATLSPPKRVAAPRDDHHSCRLRDELRYIEGWRGHVVTLASPS